MATPVWHPQEEGVKEICGLLQEFRQPSVDQSRIWQQLQRCSQFPDFNNYLTFILCRAEVLPPQLIILPACLWFSLSLAEIGGLQLKVYG